MGSHTILPATMSSTSTSAVKSCAMLLRTAGQSTARCTPSRSFAAHSPRYLSVPRSPHHLEHSRPFSQVASAAPTTSSTAAQARRNSTASSTTIPPRTTPRNGSSRTLFTAIAFGIATGYGLSLVYQPSWYKLLYPQPVALAPSASSKEGKAYTQEIEDALQALPIVSQLRAELAEPETSSATTDGSSLTTAQTSKKRKYYEVRPYEKMAVEKKRHSLTQYTLRGPGMFAVAPLLFVSEDGTDCVAIMHVGPGMCGHNGIVHGGLLATILDEAVARPAFAVLPNNIGMTVYLNTRYKAPTPADQFIVVRTKATKWAGRKAFTEGTIENLDGKVLVEADALYVEPKDAWLLKTSAVKEALGEAGFKEKVVS